MSKDDSESSQSPDENRTKRIKLAAFIGIFAISQIVSILVFVLVVLRVETPKFRIGNGIVTHSLTSGIPSTTSIEINFTAPIRIKNTNFWPYKYESATVNFTFGGVPVGQVKLPKSKASFKSTKKLAVAVAVNSSDLTSTSGLGKELNSGIVKLTSGGKLNGKVELMFFFEKKKSTNMNCTIEFNVSSKAVQSVTCR